MNEFTKEELELISEIMRHVCCYSNDEEFDLLESKIQSLIDNYCEHDNKESKLC